MGALIKQINQAESLDEVISAHDEFLCTLVSRALLDERSREILTQLRAIYDRILEFQTIANRIHDDAMAEWDARQTRSLLINSKTKSGGYGTTEQMDNQDKDRRKVYVKNKLGSAKAQLRIVSQSYGDMVRTFLYQLTCSHDERQQAQQATHLLPQKDEHEWDEHPHDLQPDDCQLDVHGAVRTKHILIV